MTGDGGRLEERVVRAAEAALTDQQFVAPVDVLVGLGWLPVGRVDAWRQGRVPYLEAAATANLSKLSTAMRVFRRWAQLQGLQPSETAYVSRTRDRRQLRFSKSGDPQIELAYRTHWVSPALSERKRERLEQRASKPPDLVVIWALKEWSCSSCGGDGELLIMEDGGPMCLVCAEMDHLVYLPAGNTALTRRAKKASRLSAVVVRFSRSRRRYERQGLLLELPALEGAEAECLADEDLRERRRERGAARRPAEDAQLQAHIADHITRLFPGCPGARADGIARHTAERGSGRVGRTHAAGELDPHAIELAVAASVRHGDTNYDTLLMSGVGRAAAREQVRDDVAAILALWRGGA